MPNYARQFSSLPPYALADVPKIKAELIGKGVDVIDLGAGDADQMPPPQTIKAIQDAVTEERMSRYPFQRGLPEFRTKIAEWTKLRTLEKAQPAETQARRRSSGGWGCRSIGSRGSCVQRS